MVPPASYDAVLIREHLYQDSKNKYLVLPPTALKPGFRPINEIGIGYNNYHFNPLEGPDDYYDHGRHFIDKGILNINSLGILGITGLLYLVYLVITRLVSIKTSRFAIRLKRSARHKIKTDLEKGGEFFLNSPINFQSSAFKPSSLSSSSSSSLSLSSPTSSSSTLVSSSPFQNGTNNTNINNNNNNNTKLEDDDSRPDLISSLTSTPEDSTSHFFQSPLTPIDLNLLQQNLVINDDDDKPIIKSKTNTPNTPNFQFNKSNFNDYAIKNLVESPYYH